MRLSQSWLADLTKLKNFFHLATEDKKDFGIKVWGGERGSSWLGIGQCSDVAMESLILYMEC